MVLAVETFSNDSDRRDRNVLQGMTIGFLALHVWHGTRQGGGGWRTRHGGLWGAIRQFFVLNAKDPVLSAGMSDFLVVATLLGVKLVYELPAEERWTWKTRLLLPIYVLFPGLGALLFFIWLRPLRRSAVAR
ncbi:Uncharacterised protein [Mycobacteroides abscessus subsp. bolletii]|nr:Uncharacterised protein [Mycobacteroides abscessus subsp. bolletii]SKF78014.1 Uncharacterised protein [Mycobacteroides abscessus subsp. bolletii]SKH65486.1 Uncharacterised protein [Mycobacteroides abscessus subsp. bolletii]SKH75346.1 Uncharacterised protein [Mycobacteroides abscessus subsp. bolletii]SKH80875.1 Uncharacterised protein [Mycobacteroides abscessus subsp. bolletii]